MVYKSGQIFLPFCHNTRVWRTDRILITIPCLHYMQRGKKQDGEVRGKGGAPAPCRAQTPCTANNFSSEAQDQIRHLYSTYTATTNRQLPCIITWRYDQ